MGLLGSFVCMKVSDEICWHYLFYLYLEIEIVYLRMWMDHFLFFIVFLVNDCNIFFYFSKFSFVVFSLYLSLINFSHEFNETI